MYPNPADELEKGKKVQEDQDDVRFAVDVKADMNRYKEALMSILRDIYVAKPEMAPRVYTLIHRCDGVLALTERLETKAIAFKEAKELIGERVNELMEMTEEFLRDLSESTGEEGDREFYYQGAAS